MGALWELEDGGDDEDDDDDDGGVAVQAAGRS